MNDMRNAEKNRLLLILVKLAELGAYTRPVNIPTKNLGQLLSMSQQTASRHIRALEKHGLVTRTVSHRGQQVKITGSGLQELAELYRPLFKVFEKPLPIVFRGTVFTGVGDGEYYMRVYQPLFKEALGFKPFHGTLNLKAATVEDLKALQRLRMLPAIEIKAFKDRNRWFGSGRCLRVTVNSVIEGAVVFPERTHYGQDVLEVIAPEKIRDKLNLKDGDTVTVEVTT